MTNSSFKILCLLAALAAGLSGCAGYRIGSTLSPDIRSIYVPTFDNKSGEPDLEAEATDATIQEFQRDGTLKIAGLSDADVILNVVIMKYELKPVGYSSDRVTETSEYRMLLFADIELTNRATGQTVLKNSKIRGRTTFTVPGDLALAKQTALPDAVRDLAHEIVEQVVEAW